MIEISDAAGEKIKEMLASQESSDLYLRIGVSEGGCSGFSYAMGFDPEKKDQDAEYTIQGLRIILDETSKPYLNGLEVDYQDSAMGGGFTMHNPNAVATCGCGSSFRTRENAGKPEEC